MQMRWIPGKSGQLRSAKPSRQARNAAPISYGVISTGYENISALNCVSCQRFAIDYDLFLLMRVTCHVHGMVLVPWHAWHCDDTTFIRQWRPRLMPYLPLPVWPLRADDLN